MAKANAARQRLADAEKAAGHRSACGVRPMTAIIIPFHAKWHSSEGAELQRSRYVVARCDGTDHCALSDIQERQAELLARIVVRERGKLDR